ncbi:hypothetical protein CVS40_9494 [Lucilia cuprina]|nr:hypothetical protein CVS40_9494 [Lucilia cuprina]
MDATVRFILILSASNKGERNQLKDFSMLGKFTSNHVQVYHQYSRTVSLKKPKKLLKRNERFVGVCVRCEGVSCLAFLYKKRRVTFLWQECKDYKNSTIPEYVEAKTSSQTET